MFPTRPVTTYHAIAKESSGSHFIPEKEFKANVLYYMEKNPTWSKEKATNYQESYFRLDNMMQCQQQIRGWFTDVEYDMAPPITVREATIKRLLVSVEERYSYLADAVYLYFFEHTRAGGRAILNERRGQIMDHEVYLDQNEWILEYDYLLSLLRKVIYNIEFIYYHFDILEAMDNTDE